MTAERPGSVLVIGATGSIGVPTVALAARLGLSVRAVSRSARRARRALGDDVDIVEADITDAASLRGAVAGMGAVIMTHGGDMNPERVCYGPVVALLEALDGRSVPVALMSSINVTHHSLGPFAAALDWKLRGERLLRASGLPVTVVRPGWFDDAGPGDNRVELRQGDTVVRAGVRRDHVAQTLVEAVLTPEAAGRTVEVFSAPGAPIEDWAALFAATRPDEPGAFDGPLDRPSKPLDAEPGRVRDDLERFSR